MIRPLVVFLAFVSVGPLVAQNVPPSFRAPGWTEYTAAGTRDWTAITASDDGSKLAATVNGGKVWTSENGGATWTERTNTTSRFFTAIASSADGSVIAAVATTGPIQVSTDGGATWHARGSSAFRRDISISADGEKMVTAIYGGAFQASTSKGATWTDVVSAGSRDWVTAEISGDGEVFVGGVEGGQIHVSVNAGMSWSARESNRNWIGLAASHDGTKLAATVNSGGGLYLSSNSGVDWTKSTAGDRDWRSVSMSADGTELVAIAFGGNVFTSTNSGATWTPRPVAGTRNWRAAVMSRNVSQDGGRCYAAAFAGAIYGAVPDLDDTISVFAGSGPQTFPQFITGLAPGSFGANPGVTPVFQAFHDNAPIFSTAPAFSDNSDGSADLEFTPSATVGSKIVTTTVEVTDPGDEENTQTSAPHRFQISVTAPPVPTADLSNLTLSEGTLDPVFASETTVYTVTVPNAVASITVTPTLVDLDDIVKVNNQTVSSGTASGNVALGVGLNPITVVVTDAGEEIVKTYTINVTRQNGPPTDLTLTGTSVPENSPPNTVVGTLGAVDPDSGQIFTFSFATGGADNGSFLIDGTELWIQSAPDFEDKRAYEIRVQVSDGAGGSFEEDFVIEVMDRNEPPSFTAGDAQSHPSTTSAVTIPDWATDIEDGDSGEQELTFTVTEQGSSGLFTVSPAVDASGNLSFTPNGTVGTATFQVTLADDDGIGGDPALSTDPQTLTITITATAPKVTAPTHRDITKSSAILGGTVSSDGGNPVPAGARGIVFQPADASGDPVLEGDDVIQVAAEDGGTGSFTVEVDGLELDTSYKYRAYATNSVGTAYSSVDTFTTLPGDPDITIEIPEGTLMPASGVIGWGLNDQGQTTPPADLGAVLSIAAGYDHTLAVKSDGSVAAWGKNDFGQRNVPAGLSGVVAVAAGAQHSLALKEDGTVVAWGLNDALQANVPANLTAVVAIAAGAQHSVALKADGTVVSWGTNAQGQSNAPADLREVKAIAAGAFHTLALKNDGTVVAWGAVGNSFGVVNVPANLNEVVAIAAGFHHNLALRANGTVVAWGANGDGQRTIPDKLADVTGIAAGSYHSLALKKDGKVVAWGRGTDGQTVLPPGAGGVLMIAGGFSHSVAATGPSLDLGEIHLGKSSAAVPITVGNVGLSALILGPPATAGVHANEFLVNASALASPVQPMEATQFSVQFSPIALGARLARIVLPNNDPDENATVVFVKGVGIPAPTAPTVTDPTVTHITSKGARLGGKVGNDGGAPLTVRGVIVAPPSVTGDFVLGTEEVLDFPASDRGIGSFTVAASGLAPNTNYRFRAYAANADATGYSDISTFTAEDPAPEITLFSPEGKEWPKVEVRELDFYSGQTTVPSGLSDATAIASGAFTRTALKSNGTVVPWEGEEWIFPAGLSNVTAIASGSVNYVALKSDGTVVTWGSNDNGKTTVPPGLSNVTAVAFGFGTILALKSDGTVVAWGTNVYGEATIPLGLSGVTAIAGGSEHSLALKNDGTVVGWGRPQKAFVPLNLFNVTAIAAGVDHNLALKTDGTVVAWGNNSYGKTTVPSNLSDVTAVVAGIDHSLALKSDGTVVMWGKIKNFQLTDVVSIAGTGHLQTLALVGPKLDFATQAQGSASASRTVTLQNTGSAPLDLGALSIVGVDADQFAFDTTGMAASLEPGDSTSFGVTFTPTGAGLRTAFLVVPSNDADEGRTTIRLEGIGEAALSALSIFKGFDQVIPEPAFQPSTTAYKLTIPPPFPETGLGIVPTPAGNGTNVTRNSTVVVNSSETSSEVEVVVSSADRRSQRSYKLKLQYGAVSANDFASAGARPGKITLVVAIPNVVNPRFATDFTWSVGTAGVPLAAAFAAALSGEAADPETAVLSDPVEPTDLTIDGSNHPGGVTFEATGGNRLFHVLPGNKLTLIRCKLINGGGGAFTENGAAILNEGELVLIDCEFENNATLGDGGAIFNAGTLTAERVTFARNQSGQNGGAIHNAPGATAEILHGTFSGNAAVTGGAVYNAGDLQLDHSTVAGNADGTGAITNFGNLSTLGLLAAGNSVSDLHNSGTWNRVTANLVGLVSGSGETGGPDPLAGVPGLRPLARNGGHTRTMALVPGSPALDALDGEAAGVAFDQRGLPVVGAGDLGAYELQPLHYRWTTLAGEGYDFDSVDGPSGVARFGQPHSVVQAPDGTLYVADRGNHTIRRIGTDGIVSTFAGTAGEAGSTDGIGTEASFNSPAGLALDAEGNLFVAESGNHTIRRITPEGEVTTFAGTADNPGYEDGTGAEALFAFPYGLAFDDHGILYVADAGNHLIRRITPEGEVTTFAGSVGNSGLSDGPGISAEFGFPTAISLGADGYFYVADTDNHAIRRIDREGGVTTVVGNGFSGSGDGTVESAGVSEPWGVGADGAGNVYFTEFGNDGVRVVTFDGFVTTLGGLAEEEGAVDGDGSEARFTDPAQILVIPGGRILLADAGSHRIVEGELLTGLSSEASLLDLTLSDGELDPVFSSEVTAYEAAVAAGIDEFTLWARATEEGATVTYLGDRVDPVDGINIALDPGSNVLPLVVTAPNGVTRRTYLLTVHRMDKPVLDEALVFLDGDSADLAGSVLDDGGDSGLEFGFVYSEASLNTAPALGGLGVESVTGSGEAGEFGAAIGELRSATRYAVRAYATNAGGTAYSDFTTFFHTDTAIDLDSPELVYDRDLLPGESQRYRFTLNARRIFRFNAAGADSLRFEIRDADGNLAAASTSAGGQSFSGALSAGDYTLVIYRAEAPRDYVAEDYVLSFGTTVIARSRPDVAAGPSATRLTGLLDYRAAALQIATIVSKKARPVTGWITVRNRGNLSDALRLRSSAGNPNFRVAYFNRSTNVTAALLARSLLTQKMDASTAPVSFRCSITPNRRKLVTRKKVNLKRSITLLLRADSTAVSGPTDSAGLKVNTR